MTAALTGIAAALLVLAVGELMAGRSRGAARGPAARPDAPRGAAARPHGAGRLAAPLARLGRRAGLRLPAPAGAAARIEAAGLRPALAGELAAIRAGAAVAGGLAGLTLLAATSGPAAAPALIVAPLLGALAPDLALHRAAARRRRAVDDEAADVLDLLRVATSAGLGLGRALGEVGQRHRGVLGDELRAAARQVEVGVPRAQALARLARRCPTAEVEGLVAAALRADRHGTPLGPALAGLAADARARRRRRLQERAAAAAPKVQLVVALAMVPSVMLLLAAATVGRLL